MPHLAAIEQLVQSSVCVSVAYVIQTAETVKMRSRRVTPELYSANAVLSLVFGGGVYSSKKIEGSL